MGYYEGHVVGVRNSCGVGSSGIWSIVCEHYEEGGGEYASLWDSGFGGGGIGKFIFVFDVGSPVCQVVVEQSLPSDWKLELVCYLPT